MNDSAKALEALEQARHKFELCGATGEFDTIKAALSANGGKVVQGEPVAFGYVDPDVYSKGSVGGGISKTPTDTRTLAVYTHPAESREEIQAQALEGFADDIDRRVDEWKAAKENALYRSIIEGQEWSGRAREKAARLRTAGDEENDQ